MILIETYQLFAQHTSIIGNDTIDQIGLEDINMPTVSSYYKINSNDFAIIGYRRSLYAGDDLAEQVQVKRKKVDGHYYPVLIKVIAPGTINIFICKIMVS